MVTATLESYLDDGISTLSLEVRQDMLKEIGNLDSYFRDELIYQSFVKVIFSNQLNTKELHCLLKSLIDEEFLYYRIGESDKDSVFTRSFSALVIAALIEYDVTKKVLDPDIILATAHKVSQYMTEEKDTRGFVEEKGWAHAIAHGADALDACAKHPLIQTGDVRKILHAVQHSLFRQANYLDEEEERLATIISSLVKYQNAEKDIQLWIEKMTELVETQLAENKGSLESFHTKRTVKNFLKSVYIILNSQEIGEKLNKEIFKVLEKWMYLR